MNRLLILLLLIIPATVFAQVGKKAMGIPFVDGKVMFDSTLTVSGKSKTDIYNAAVKFCRVHDFVIDQDPVAGKISAMGHATCPTPKEETIRYHIFFAASDSTLRVVITNITFKKHEYENDPAVVYPAEEVFAAENYFKPNGKANQENVRYRDCAWALVNTLYLKALKIASK